MGKKLTLDYIKFETLKLAEGYICKATKYKNNQTKMLFICKKEHEFFVTWANFGRKNGTRCPICSNEKKGKPKVLLERKRKYLEKFGYVFKSNTLKYAIEKDKMICNKGHKIKISWSNFKKGHRCAICSLKGRTKHKNEIGKENYYSYKECVDRFTNKNFCKYYYLINPNRLKRAYDRYHLDHIFSIIDGFENKVSARIIANPFNLQMLWCEDNINKWKRSDITIEELYIGYNAFNKLKQKDSYCTV